ncbi:MAG: isoaspartyl peptidase/L-asparaginase [Pseudomonadota bacterium]
MIVYHRIVHLTQTGLMTGALWMLAGIVLSPILQADEAPVAIAIHGGAGTIDRASLSDEREQRIRAALETAVTVGHAVLIEGGSSLDAVTRAITLLEDEPEFNAGRGAVLTHDGYVELDASIMTGHDLAAGAVAGVRGVRHPILAARGVLEQSPHVMLSGSGADAFARELGLEFKPEDWFITEFRRGQLERAQATPQAAVSHDASRWFSTVGAVALDQSGHLAAATSTGGMTNKRYGRVGDSPIIGAGTYADDRSCAISATGHGEYFIRHVVAYSICVDALLSERTLAESADRVVNEVLVEAGGSGGVIAVGPDGAIAMPFNTPGMYRAAIHVDGRLEISIYGDEE